jgi:hypothetical protein
VDVDDLLVACAACHGAFGLGLELWVHDEVTAKGHCDRAEKVGAVLVVVALQRCSSVLAQGHVKACASTLAALQHILADRGSTNEGELDHTWPISVDLDIVLGAVAAAADEGRRGAAAAARTPLLAGLASTVASGVGRRRQTNRGSGHEGKHDKSSVTCHRGENSLQ